MGIEFEVNIIMKLIEEYNLNIVDDVKVFLISDTHFFHSNIINYTGRPFKTAEDMNETIFDRWNDTVGENDIVIFCGDFVCGIRKKHNISNVIYKSLNGIKYFLKGNHDTLKGINYQLYNRITFKIFDKRIICQHYPIVPESVDCDIAIVGHSHNNDNPMKTIYKLNNQINVSCELINYTPIQLTKDLIDEKNWSK